MLLLTSFVAGTAAAATADRGDAQRRISSADQALARSLLLKQSDLAPDVKSEASSGANENGPYCKALDESDLVLTADVEGRLFSREAQGTYAGVTSSAQLYRTKAMAASSWARGTSAAGLQCAKRVLAGSFARDGFRLDSLRRTSFANLADRTVAYRVILSRLSAGIRVRLYFDVLVLARGRAQATVLFISLGAPFPQSSQVPLARVVANRMATALPPGTDTA